MKVTDTSLNTYAASYPGGGPDQVGRKRTSGAEDSVLPPTLPAGGTLDGQIGNDGQIALPPPDKTLGGADQQSIDSLTRGVDDAISNVGIDVADLMKVMYSMAQKQREAARLERRVETDAQAKSMDEQAQKTRDAADDGMAGAVVSSAMSIAGGAASIAGGVAGAAKIKVANAAANEKVAPMQKMQTLEAAGATPAGAGKAPTTMEIEQIRQGAFTQQTKPVDMWLQMFQGGSQVLQGTGGIIKGHFDREAGYREAEKTGKEKEAMLHQTARDVANDQVQQLADWLHTLRGDLADLYQKQFDTRKGISDRMNI